MRVFLFSCLCLYADVFALMADTLVFLSVNLLNIEIPLRSKQPLWTCFFWEPCFHMLAMFPFPSHVMAVFLPSSIYLASPCSKNSPKRRPCIPRLVFLSTIVPDRPFFFFFVTRKHADFLYFKAMR